MDSHSTMDIDNWTCEMRPQSDLAKSYSIGGQPPSIGNVRQIVVSEHSGGNQICSDGQPPSINDVRRQEASQSEASCNRYEGPDEHEVQQIYKRGTFGRSNEITAYSGYDMRTQDLDSSSRFGSKVGVPPTTFNFNSIDLAINENGFLNGGVLAPPPQRFQRIGTCIKVYKRGTVERPIDITAYTGYDQQLKQEVARIFSIEGQLDSQQGIGWKLVYVDHENDILLVLVGDDPWDEFVNHVHCIKILSLQEVQQMGLNGDCGGNSVLPNQACYSWVVEQFNGGLANRWWS